MLLKFHVAFKKAPRAFHFEPLRKVDKCSFKNFITLFYPNTPLFADLTQVHRDFSFFRIKYFITDYSPINRLMQG